MTIYTHHKIVFGKKPKTILPEYNCNQDLFFEKTKNQIGFSIVNYGNSEIYNIRLNIKIKRKAAFGHSELLEKIFRGRGKGRGFQTSTYNGFNTNLNVRIHILL